MLMTIYPLSAIAFVRRPRSLFFKTVMPLVSAVFIVLLFATDLLITGTPYLYSGVILQGREGPLFVLYGLVLFACLFFGYALLLGRLSRDKDRSVVPLLVGSGVAILTGLFDSLRIFLPVRIGVGSLLVYGIILMNLFYGYTIFKRFIDLYRRIDEDERTIRSLLNVTRKDFLELVELVVKTIDAKDNYTAGHSKRVRDYALSLAKAVDLDETSINALKTASLLHDIGKIGVSEHILKKPGKLTEEEFNAIKLHPETGVSILGNFGEFRSILDHVLHHHERMDGTGYPQGISGEQIPVIARIIAVADTFDALTSDRPYRKALSREDSLRILREVAGTQLDPFLVEKFIPLV
jgi:putative nucleotidyltransferase with HDIG domain